MIFSPPPRNFRAELLDLDQAPFEEVKDSLEDVQRVNRYLSGYRVLLHHMSGFLNSHDRPDRPMTVLDAATGSADQPIAVVQLARQLGVPIRVLAIDINPKMLAFARQEAQAYPEIRFLQCDALNLPFRADSFDVVMNSLSLHHFERDFAVAMLRAFSFLGRRGFVVNDLHRSRVAHASIFILTRLLTRNRLTRYDAPVSVMNAFTPKELQEMAEEAEITYFEIHRHFPYRLALVQKKPVKHQVNSQ